MNYNDRCLKIKGLEELIEAMKNIQPRLYRHDTDWGRAGGSLLERMEDTLDRMYAERGRYRREFFKLNGRWPVEGGAE